MLMKPKKAIIGPTTMRRVEKMSGLYCSPLGSPTMRANPMTIMSRETAISIILSFGNVFIIKLNKLHVTQEKRKVSSIRFTQNRGRWSSCGYICLLQKQKRKA